MRPSLLTASLGCALLTALWTAAADEEPPAKAPEPARVPLRDPKIPLGKALDALTKQTGIRIEDNRGDTDPVLDLDLDKTPFWQALDTIAGKAGAGVVISPKGAAISLVKRPAEALPVQVSHQGAFRVAIKKTSGEAPERSASVRCLRPDR